MQTISYAEIAARMKTAGVATPAAPQPKRAAIDHVRAVDDPGQEQAFAVSGIAMALLCKHETQNGVIEFVNYDGTRWRLINGKGERYTPGQGWALTPRTTMVKSALLCLNGEALPVYRPTIAVFQQVFDEASRAFLPLDKQPPKRYDPLDD